MSSLKCCHLDRLSDVVAGSSGSSGSGGCGGSGRYFSLQLLEFGLDFADLENDRRARRVAVFRIGVGGVDVVVGVALDAARRRRSTSLRKSAA